MERINGSITAAIKSRVKPDENIGTILELDIHCSLLPFVIPGMQTALAKKAYSDPEGRLQLQKVFRDYVKGNMSDDEASSAGEDSDLERGTGGHSSVISKQNRRHIRKRDYATSSKVDPVIIESFLTSEYSDFELDKEVIEEEFGVKLSSTDIRRAIRRLGDINMVGRVNFRTGEERQLLSPEEYLSLRSFIKEYFSDMEDGVMDFLFEWRDDDDPGVFHKPAIMVQKKKTGRGRHAAAAPCFEATELKALVEGRHHPAIRFTKWKNVRFESFTRMAEFVIDSRATIVAGAAYDKKRERSASFFEFSTDTSIKSGAHTAGNPTERVASRRSEHPREFGEAMFFITVDIDTDLLEVYPEAISPAACQYLKSKMGNLTNLYLVYCRPFSVSKVDALTVVGRIPKAARTTGTSRTRHRKYEDYRWLDVDDVVDTVGLVLDSGQEYVCWRDACWDSVLRTRLKPLRWEFTPNPYGDPPTLPGPGEEQEAGDMSEHSEDDNIMRTWTPDSTAAGSNKTMGRIEESPTYQPSVLDPDDQLSDSFQDMYQQAVFNTRLPEDLPDVDMDFDNDNSPEPDLVGVEREPDAGGWVYAVDPYAPDDLFE